MKLYDLDCAERILSYLMEEEEEEDERRNEGKQRRLLA